MSALLSLPPHLLVPPLAYLSLGFNPSPLLTPILLSLLLHLASSPAAPFLSSALLIPLLSPGISLSYYTEIYSALGSKVETLVGLSLLGVVYATGVAIVVGGWGWVRRAGDEADGRGVTGWLGGSSTVVRAVGFPVLWTTVWGLLGWVGPLGRMGAWTPINGFLFDSLAPLVRVLGPAVIDFTVASTAVLLASAYPVIAASTGTGSSNGHRQRDLIQIQEVEEVEPYRDDPSTGLSQSNAASLSPIARISSRTVLSSTALIVLALFILPSTIPNPVPLNQPITTHTPFTLACILPPAPSGTSLPHLDAFLAESRRVGSSANALIWPEGAVRVDNQADYDGMIDRVGAVASSYGRWKVDGDEDDGGRVKKWNSVVWVGPDGKVVGGYRKTKTIPIAESFAVASHPNPAPDLVFPLPHPPHVSRSRWSTAEQNYTRSIHFTSVICNDLNFPSLLRPVSAQTSLTLVPSSTWSTPIGLTLLAQARSRALESSSPLLLCDGSRSGVSAFIDDWGRILSLQVGGGSFVARWEVPGTGGEVRKRGGRWGVYWGGGWVLGGLVGSTVVAMAVEWAMMSAEGGEARRRVGEGVARVGGRIYWLVRGARRPVVERDLI